MRSARVVFLVVIAMSAAAVMATHSHAQSYLQVLPELVAPRVGPIIIPSPNFPPVDTLGPYPTLFAYTPATLGFPQPIGHEVIWTGPNGYIYRPIHAPRDGGAMANRPHFTPTSPRGPADDFARPRPGLTDDVRSAPARPRLRAAARSSGPREF